MRITIVRCVLLSAALAFTAQAKPLHGGPKTIAMGSDASVPGVVAAPQMGQGGYVSGATTGALSELSPLIRTARDKQIRDARPVAWLACARLLQHSST